MTTTTPIDTLKVISSVVAPTIAGGVIKRRPRVMGLLEKMQADRSAVRTLQDLRARYGPGLLRLSQPGRPFALVLSAADVGRVLAEAPEPFSPASREKKAALRQFRPHGVLISQGAPRQRRREFNETVLETARPVHHLMPVIMATIREETAALPSSGTLDWNTFEAVWWRIVRRIVLGNGARDDQATTDLIGRLRRAANWSFAAPPRRTLRAKALGRLQTHLDRAEPDSLAGVIAQHPDPDAVSQVGHWLFAFDAAGMVTFRALALLATHPACLQRALTEAPDAPDLPFLRACALDTVRLWPTTPAILRETTKEIDGLPAGTGLLIFTPLFHRDDENLPYAHSFTPDIWLDGQAQDNPALVPFSAGPAECPARNLMATVTSTLLAALLTDREFQLTSDQRLSPAAPLPSTLDNFGLTFSVGPRERP